MLNSVRNGHLQSGTISEITFNELEDRDIFESRTLMRTDFKLLVGKSHPLSEVDEIDSNELLEKYSYYDDYLPFASFDDEEYRGKKVDSTHSLAWSSVRYLPRWQLTFDGEDSKHDGCSDSGMFVLPGMLNRPEFSDLHEIKLNNLPRHNMKIFWLKENQSGDIKKFKEALDFAGLTV